MNIAVIFDKNLTPLQQFIWCEHQTNLLMANKEWYKLSPEQQDAIKKDIEQSPDTTLIRQVSVMPNPYHPPVNDYYGSVIVAKTTLGSFYYRRR